MGGGVLAPDPCLATPPPALRLAPQSSGRCPVGGPAAVAPPVSRRCAGRGSVVPALAPVVCMVLRPASRRCLSRCLGHGPGCVPWRFPGSPIRSAVSKRCSVGIAWWTGRAPSMPLWLAGRPGARVRTLFLNHSGCSPRLHGFENSCGLLCTAGALLVGSAARSRVAFSGAAVGTTRKSTMWFAPRVR